MVIDDAISELSKNTKNVRFERLIVIVGSFFEKREEGKKKRGKGSHHVFKSPWQGDPRINLQKSKTESGKAKEYQVKQVLTALEKLRDLHKQS